MKRKDKKTAKYADNQIISTQDIILSDIQRLRISIKNNGTETLCDIRKWIKYPNLDDFVPTRKGIMFPLTLWHEVKSIMDTLTNDQVEFVSK